MWSFVWLELNVELCRVLPPILEVVLIIVLADQRQSLHSIGTPKNLVTYILTIDSISLGHIRNNCIPSLGASQFNSALEMYFLFLLTLMFSADADVVFSRGCVCRLLYFEKESFLFNLEIVLYNKKNMFYGIQRKYCTFKGFNLTLQRIKNNRTRASLFKFMGDVKQSFMWLCLL